MTVWRLLWTLDGTPVLLGGLFYALFSRLWFTYIPWSGNYHGAFSEKFMQSKAKVRSAVIRFCAGCMMSVLVGLMSRVLQLVLLEAFLKLGLFISLGIATVSLVQYVNGNRSRRGEILLETFFQIVAMEGICAIWAWWQNANGTPWL